ncbi:2-hydroxycarboxylate transporter family protein [Thaumasiovibrio sp. DFM-14]|uniref:2-hydroxycarboxylate transporter family protein n=1 Tax=Thaumasiovibrio sp. DFM-14 TaxID=3384792 RepID=UPI00399F467A
MNKFHIKEIPLPYFMFFLAISSSAALLGKLPSGLVGGLAIMMSLGYLFEHLGDRTPVVKDYLGGGPIVCMFLSAALVYWGIMPDTTKVVIDGFMKGGGFLTFYIASLVVGSILGIDSKLLIKAGVRFAVPVIMGLLFAVLLCGFVAMIIGYGAGNGVAFITYPIMGGGLGAGALPIAEIFNKAISMETDEILSLLIPAMALGNVASIVAGGMLYRLGNKHPSLTGNGQLMVSQQIDDVKSDDRELSLKALAIGIFTACSLLLVGRLLNLIVPGVHYYALMIITVAILKVGNFFPKLIEDACATWFSFMAKYLTTPLLVGVGVTYTDLGMVINALTLENVLLVISVIVGAIVGAGLGGRLVGFYFIESSLCAGLCMANMGGTGDIAVLSAARRMELIPFAQISSRIGGAMILVIVGLTVPFLF